MNLEVKSRISLSLSPLMNKYGIVSQELLPSTQESGFSNLPTALQ